MLGSFSVIRLSQSETMARFAAVLLSVALALSGCRILSPHHSPPSPTSVSPDVRVPTVAEPDPYSAFRPIMPGQIVHPIPSPLPPAQPIPVQEPPRIEPLNIEPKREMIEQSQIDELNKRISELESQLIEAWKVQAPPPDIAESEPPMIQKVEAKPVRRLPIISREGVYVSADEFQNIRIEVKDKSLFVSNAWQLSAEGEETLRAIAAEIRASDSNAILDIEGHTDSLMGDPNNPMQKHDISTAKTKAVMNFFVNSLRWDVARIGTSSYGRSRPVAENGNAEGRARNNRVEIVVRNGDE